MLWQQMTCSAQTMFQADYERPLKRDVATPHVESEMFTLLILAERLVLNHRWWSEQYGTARKIGESLNYSSYYRFYSCTSLGKKNGLTGHVGHVQSEDGKGNG